MMFPYQYMRRACALLAFFAAAPLPAVTVIVDWYTTIDSPTPASIELRDSLDEVRALGFQTVNAGQSAPNRPLILTLAGSGFSADTGFEHVTFGDATVTGIEFRVGPTSVGGAVDYTIEFAVPPNEELFLAVGALRRDAFSATETVFVQAGSSTGAGQVSFLGQFGWTDGEFNTWNQPLLWDGATGGLSTSPQANGESGIAFFSVAPVTGDDPFVRFSVPVGYNFSTGESIFLALGAHPIPEPAHAALFGALACLGLLLFHRRRLKQPRALAGETPTRDLPKHCTQGSSPKGPKVMASNRRLRQYADRGAGGQDGHPATVRRRPASGLTMRFWTLLGRLSLFAFAVGGLLPTARAQEAPPTTAGIQFTGSPGRVTLDPGFSLAGRSFTVEAWIWLNAAGGDRPVLAQVGGSNLLHLVVRNNRLYFGFWNDDLAGATDVPTGEWVHVAYTYDEATREQRVFLNGVLDGSRTANASFAENNLPLHIGAYSDFSLNPFDGRVLELRVWDHARDAATLSAGRFTTPPVDAPGLDALFTFTGADGSDLPEATGSLSGNTLHGAVTVVDPVAGPAFLGEEFPQQALPTGSLVAAVEAYTFSVDPAAAFADPDGEILLNGTGPARVWGTPWLADFGAEVDSIVVWETGSPEISLTLSGPARVDALTLHLANSGGANGIGLPATVRLTSPAGFLREVTVTPGSDTGALQAVTFEDVDAVAGEWTVQLVRGAHAIALAGIAIDGALLQNQSIDFPEIGERQVTETLFLTAESSSELPVAFSVLSGPGVIEPGNELRFTGPGVVLVAAEQPGNEFWNPAEPALRAFEVRGGERIFAPGDGLTAGLELGSLPGRLSVDPSLSLAGRSFTVEAWIRLDTVDGDQPVLAQFGSSGVFHLILRNGRVHLGFWGDDLTGGSVLPAGEWIHLAYTFDADTLEQRVYVNGVNDGSRIANGPFPENNLPLQIGGGFSEFSNPFNGRILDLRVWDHARPAPVLFAGRFQTPPSNAPGLEALFTFTGATGASVPEATGQLDAGTLSGDVAVVEPVIGPEYLLGFAFPRQPLASGSLAPSVSSYTIDTAPEAAFADPAGSLLTNGFGPARVWGTPWLETLNPPPSGIVVWEDPAPAITFQFSERVRVDGITLHLANSGGAEGIERPTAVTLSTPGGFAQTFAIAPGATPTGLLEPIEIDDFQLYTDALTLTLSGNAPRIALAEVSFDGAALADPALQAQDGWLTLPAKRFLGLAPDAVDASAIDLEVVLEEAGARFEFPRAADDFGVQAVVKWSTNLVDWTPLPYAPAAEAGRVEAVLTPPPAEGRAFFRLVFPDGPPTVATPGSVSAMESDGLLAFHPLAAPGAIETPLDPASLQLLAINDQPVDAFTGPIATPSGGILEILPDGTITYAANPGLAEGQVAEETLTYTVVDRFGRSVRNTFTLSVVGENDPPSVGSFTGTHESGAVDAGVAYRYFSGSFATEAAFDTATPVRSGRIPTVALDPADFDGSGGALEITGELFVPASGPYTFYLTGSHGSVLDVGGTRVVDYDAANHTPARSGTIELSAGSHPIRVRYFDAVFSEGNAALTLEYAGPGFLREAIPANAFPRLTDLPIALASDPDDGDVLRISHLNGVPVPEGAAAVLPSGATLLLAESGQITYRPAPGRTILHASVDTETFTFTVSDAGGLSATGTAEIELRRLNAAPVAPSSIALQVNNQEFAQVIASEVVEGADGDSLRITHVNGTPLPGGSVLSLPSYARVSLSTAPLSTSINQGHLSPVPFGLRYDALNSTLRTLSQSENNDSFVITITDSAGAAVDVEMAGSWGLSIDNFIGYIDNRFASGGDLGPHSARIWSRYRFPVEMVTYITDRETGESYGHTTRTLHPNETHWLNFDLPEGIDLDGDHFFDRFDLEIDTLDGDPIYYGSTYDEVQVGGLYSTATESFFQFRGAISPHWPYRVETNRGTTFFKSGFHRFATDYGDSAQVFRLDVLARGTPANRAVLEPNFAANITIQGVCRTRDISRFSIQNLNDEPVPFTVGTGNTVFTVAAGQTKTIEIPYAPNVEFRVLQASLGLFDSNEETCVATLDFTATSFCANTFQSFTQVQNNDPDNAYTVRVESVQFPAIRSDPVTIANQGNSIIQMMTQGQNLSGTEGRVIVILPGDIEVEAATFIFSDTPC
jgi:hypothetical protein